MQHERPLRSGYTIERRDLERDSRGRGRRDDRREPRLAEWREKRRDDSRDTRDRSSSRSSFRGRRPSSYSSRFSVRSRNSDNRKSYTSKGQESVNRRSHERCRREDNGKFSRPQDKSRQGRSGTRGGCFNYGSRNHWASMCPEKQSGIPDRKKERSTSSSSRQSGKANGR